MKEVSDFTKNVLSIVRQQIRQGIHISNINLVEYNISKIGHRFDKDTQNEINGIISQIRSDNQSGKMNRDLVMKYTNGLNTCINKIGYDDLEL